ncbi:MAG TPA: hypothetical protein VF508_12550, partial [Pyrinomonadaceae bacterium]
TRRVTTFAGTGKAGQSDGARPEFYEPGGLAVARGRLYVADTNNHAVRVVDLSTKQTTTLLIRGLEPPPAAPADAVAEVAGPNAEELKTQAQKLSLGGDASLVLNVQLPAGYHLNPSAPHRYRVTVESGGENLAVAAREPSARNAGDPTEYAGTSKALRLPLVVPLRPKAAGAAQLRAQLTLYYCREDNTGTCRVKTLVWRAPLDVTAEAGAPREIRLQGKVE